MGRSAAFFLHLPGTLIPLVLLPGETFVYFPLNPTIEGQFVLKNLVLAAAGVGVLASLDVPEEEGKEQEPAMHL
jgi:hypothetical protein